MQRRALPGFRGCAPPRDKHPVLQLQRGLLRLRGGGESDEAAFADADAFSIGGFSDTAQRAEASAGGDDEYSLGNIADDLPALVPPMHEAGAQNVETQSLLQGLSGDDSDEEENAAAALDTEADVIQCEFDRIGDTNGVLYHLGTTLPHQRKQGAHAIHPAPARSVPVHSSPAPARRSPRGAGSGARRAARLREPGARRARARAVRPAALPVPVAAAGDLCCARRRARAPSDRRPVLVRREPRAARPRPARARAGAVGRRR
jgi:hypothetical protein